ncbi:MAG: phage tail protein [Cyanobacteriota bacterium]|nr:phage tail protein [Cyanobacteriota bacterium]
MTAFTERLTASRFYVELKLDGSQDNVDATFLECQGIERSQEAIEICEVTPQKWGKANSGQVVRTKVPGNVKTNNITLRRGMTNSKTLWDWFKAVEEGNWAKQFREGSLTIYDQAGKEQAILEFQGAWPTRYKASDFNAGSGEMEIEELEIVVDMLTRSK